MTAQRTIPIALQADKDLGVPTFCYLVKFQAKRGDVLGLTTLNRKVQYDDLLGAVTYHADPGADPSAIESTADMGVDGGEIIALLPTDGLPISEADILAGVWNGAEYYLYEVNYADLTPGRHVLLKRGTLGEMWVKDGLAVVTEIRGLTQDLKQNITPRFSVDCRTYLGSKETDELEYCGFDVDSITVAGTVTAVGAENTRMFTDSASAEAAGTYQPGVIVFTSGLNAGPEKHQVALHSAGGQFSLRSPLRFPIQVGDAYTRREDCSKKVNGTHGCKRFHGANWIFRFRGEDQIRSGDPSMVPGAEIGPGESGPGTEPMPDSTAPS